MDSKGPPAIARRMWRIVRALCYMLSKGISKRKLMMDLHVLMKRGKIAGEALGNLIAFRAHQHHHGSSGGGFFSAFSCHHMDPGTSFYSPREIEFSCSNTPAYHSYTTKRSSRRHHNRNHDYYNYNIAAIANAFEILNSEIPNVETVVASPSPVPVWSLGKSPAAVRQLRITDSPFPIMEDEGEVDCHVDVEAEEFIKRFYEQLRRQQLVPATPEPFRGWA